MTRVIVLPDIHTPNEDQRSIKPILEFIKFYKPHKLIQLGDFCDWDSVSSYDPSSENDIQTIEHEILCANSLLDDIDKVSKNCEKIMLAGNHEARYEQFRVNKGMLVGIRRMKSLTSWDQEYNLFRRKWKRYNYGEYVQLGKIIFTHGWGRSCPPKRMAERFPGRNVIYGHTHQHLIYGCCDERDLPIESESIGTLSKFNLSYMKGEPTVHWVHGFMYIDMMENGQFSKHFVHVIDGKFIEYGREFSYSPL